MKGPEFANQITTPLALAALCLLLGTGFLKTVSKAKSTAALKMTIRWGFILSIVLGVLANAAYLVIASFGREVRLAGTVRDDTEKPVPDARVDLGGKKGRTITDDDGGFELNIPDSRIAPKYKLVVTADGFEPASTNITGPRPKDEVEIVLHRPVFSAKDFVSIETTGAAKHYLGDPQFDLIVDLSNPYPHKIILENILLTLTSPTQKVTPIRLQGTFIPPGGSIMPTMLSAVPLDKGQIWSLGLSFANLDQSLGPELQRLQQEVPSLNGITPSPDTKIYSDALVKDLSNFMKDRMIWVAGQWKGKLAWSINGKAYEREFGFSLSGDTVFSMDAITNYYGSGFGVIPILSFTQAGLANPVALVQIQTQ
jgi:Carboxypeptidase regulatory-like domain